MKITKKCVAAANKIVMAAKSYDAMLAGEIPVDGGVILTDGLSLVFSPVSFALSKCLSDNYELVGGRLKNILINACNVDKVLVDKPFQLKKVSSKLYNLCKEHSIQNEHGQKFLDIEGSFFDIRQLLNIFGVVGRKACGYLGENPELFGGNKFLIIEPEECDYENDAFGVLLQSRKSGLFQETVLGRVDKVQKAIERLKNFEPPEGYYLAFSGGKDSQCIYHLAKLAGVKFDAHYSVTTVDPPELMKFIKQAYPDVEWEYHYYPDDPKYNHPSGKRRQITMWNLIANHTIPPTRQARYCCSELKETGGEGRLVVTGVRWAESVRRRDLHGVVDMRTTSKSLINQAIENNPAATLNKHSSLIFMDDNEESKRMVEYCYVRKRTTVNPIIDWEDEDVWEFLNDVVKVQHCTLYDEGYTRLGCIGCPLQGRDGMLKDFERYPRYKELYIKAFDKMIKNHPGEIKVATGEPITDTSSGGEKFSKDGFNGTLETASSKPGNQPMDQDENGNGSLYGVDQSVLSSVGGEKIMLRQWTGQQIFHLWLWAHRADRSEKPPCRLVPNGRRTT